MELSLDWLDDFYQTSCDIIQDVLLLEGMTLRMKNPGACMSQVSQTYLNETVYRLLDYLSQHAEDLCHLNQRLERM